MTSRRSDKKRPDIELLMEQADREYSSTCIRIEVHFDKRIRGVIEEYFPDSRMEDISEEKSRVWSQVPPRERLWKALLLSLGNQVEVISSEVYRNELKETARSFLSNYDI